MHLKYRPTKRSEVLGQNHIINNITLDKPILLIGPTGSGKTTIAYILANEFCEPENITERNCITNSTKPDIENILSEFFRSSIFGKEKVLILEELHGLNNSEKAQRLLLTPLETLSEHKKIIACSSTIGKLEKQLLDRFLIYKLKPLSKKDLKQLLSYVCEKENIKLERWLKILLIEKSEGSARKLLTSLPIIKNIDDKDEAEYLLDISSMDADPDVLDLFKFILSGSLEWIQIVGLITNLQKTKSSDAIRIGLINIITGRLKSKYMGSLNEGSLLIKSIKSLNNIFIPQDASLITALFDIFCLFKEKK